MKDCPLFSASLLTRNLFHTLFEYQKKKSREILWILRESLRIFRKLKRPFCGLELLRGNQQGFPIILCLFVVAAINQEILRLIRKEVISP